MNYLLTLYNSYQKINNGSNDKTKILDPLNTIIKLGILSFKQPNSKISINNHNIYIHEPSYLQGAIRIYNGDNKEDLHYLLYPIYYASLNNIDETTEILFILAKNGLVLLKDTYKTSLTINHTIDLFIYIIDNSLMKKNIEFSFVKITKEDEILNEKFIYEWKKEELKIIIDIFNMTCNSPNFNKIYYTKAIESILIPIDKTINEISYI